MTRRTWPKIGDRVVIEFCGHDKHAEVIYLPPLQPFVEVEFWLDGAEEPMRTIYKIDRLRPPPPPGRAMRTAAAIRRPR